MEATLTFIWKSAVLISLFYIVYKSFLHKETYFKSIRYFLLAGIIAAVILPFIIIPIYVTTEFIQPDFQVIESLLMNNTVDSYSTFNWMSVLLFSYFIGAGYFLIKLIIQLLSIGSLIYKNKYVKSDGYYFVEIENDISPFSFFNFIVYNPDRFSKTELEQILAHEKIHAMQHHSIDNIMANLLVAFQWFNPIAWLYKKEIEQNLEFIADECALKVSKSNRSYQQLLLKTCIPNYQMALANNFYNSLLKKRIIMLQSKKSNSKSQWKIAIILPLLIAFVFTFNTKTIAQKKVVKKEVVKITTEVYARMITKESTKEDLDEVSKSFAENGLDVKFNGVKMDKNMITNIKIEAKANNGKASASYAANDSNGINPVKISYDKVNNNLSIGSAEGTHMSELHFSDKDHKIMMHRMKGDGKKMVFIHKDGEDVEDEDVNIWVDEKGDTTKIIKKEIMVKMGEGEDNEDIQEIIIDENVDGKKIKKEIIKIKGSKGEGKDDFIFISDDDEDDANTVTTYIVNGKEMTKEEFKKMDKDKIKTIEIKKEVKKEK
jgi:hypothetical protein